MNSLIKFTLTSVLFALLISSCDSISDGNSNLNNEDDSSDIIKIELIAPLNNAAGQLVSVDLRWQKLRGGKEYNIQISTNENFNTTITDTLVEGTEYTASLEHLTTYYWKVQPISRGPQIWSDTWNFTTGGDDTEPVTAALVTPEDGAEVPVSEVVFEWEPIEEATKFHFQITADTDFDELVIDSTISTASIEVSDLESDTEYKWRVSPILETGTGTWSEIYSIIVVDDSSSNPIVELSAPEDNATGVSINGSLQWSAIDGASSYQVQLATQSDFNSPVIDEFSGTTNFETGTLQYSQTYYWRVQVDGDGESNNWSNIRSFATKSEPNDPPPSSSAFVSVHNGDFILDGSVFRFAGTNAYYLPNYEKLNSQVVDRALDLFETTGVSVVRMWAFYDGYDCGYSAQDASENVIQTSPGQYSEEALKDLDQVIAKGKERGIRFIMPFINFWDELGGVCQYNTWAGASDPSTNMEFFLNNDQTQQWFKDYISMLLNRVNTVTGVAYKDEPAIFGWQIINEGRNSGKDAQILRDWYQEIAQYIKSIDSNHLLSTGEEGFDEGTPPEYSAAEYSNTYTLRANEGTSYVMNTAIPEIDFGNAHWYPTEYGFGYTVDADFIKGQHIWAEDHQKIAESFGKPFIIGEYGYPGWGNESQTGMYNDFYTHSESIKLDGDLIWQLAADGTKCWEFGGNICYPEGRVDTDMYNAFKAHVANKTSGQ
jgi:mannan endo-1,4-beta-mannosidase